MLSLFSLERWRHELVVLQIWTFYDLYFQIYSHFTAWCSIFAPLFGSIFLPIHNSHTQLQIQSPSASRTKARQVVKLKLNARAFTLARFTLRVLMDRLGFIHCVVGCISDAYFLTCLIPGVTTVYYDTDFSFAPIYLSQTNSGAALSCQTQTKPEDLFDDGVVRYKPGLLAKSATARGKSIALL